jgi:hypothetical protein
LPLWLAAGACSSNEEASAFLPLLYTEESAFGVSNEEASAFSCCLN